MKFFCLIPVAASATIPLHFFPDGVSSFLNMYMGGPAIPFRPHLGSLNYCFASSQTAISAESSISPTNAHFENSNITMVVPPVLNQSGHGLLTWIGIGPSSHLVSLHNSVDFVRGPNGGQLMLGTSEERFFGDHCLPNSCVRFQARANESIVSTEASMLAQRRIVSFAASDYVLAFSPEDFVLTFSTNPAFFDFIEIPNGNHRPVIIGTPCGARRASLPDITVSFETGHLVLTPEDYTRMIDGDRCELLVSFDLHLTGTSTVHMNPLLIPNMNLRITNQEILLCESRES
jgi:hypothetical protein